MEAFVTFVSTRSVDWRGVTVKLYGSYRKASKEFLAVCFNAQALSEDADSRAIALEDQASLSLEVREETEADGDVCGEEDPFASLETALANPAFTATLVSLQARNNWEQPIETHTICKTMVETDFPSIPGLFDFFNANYMPTHMLTTIAAIPRYKHTCT